MTVHGDGSYGATSWVRHTTWPIPSDGEQRPVGATRIRHPGERDGSPAHPVEIVGNAERAEKAGMRADRQQAQRHRVVGVMVNQAVKVSPGFTIGSVPRPIASIVAVMGSIAAKLPRAGT